MYFLFHSIAHRSLNVTHWAFKCLFISILIDRYSDGIYIVKLTKNIMYFPFHFHAFKYYTLN